MSAHDVSRHLFTPQYHYTGLRMQQGRVVLDSDINEARMLDEEHQRALLVDVVGPHGSPDSGFTVAEVNTAAPYDFKILAGTYYLGGYRHEIAGSEGPLDPQTFRAQSNWRQSSRSDEHPAPPALPTAPRSDLVYLVGWEQGVSAREDAELHEQAIAVHDTGYRIRRMDRVYVRTNSHASCKESFAALVSELTADGHTFDFANFELKSAARLMVLADPFIAAEDLCTPPVLHGFSGAENQAIRVQLVRPNRLLWSFDNASQLHRLTVTVEGDLITLTLITTPRDHAHIPLVDQIVELLPWGAALSNGEHVADHEISDTIGGGVLARVLTPYDPTTQTLTVAVESDDALTALLEWFASEAVPVDDRYLFARLWNPGGGAAQGQFGITFDPGDLIPLPGTGLKLRMTNVGIPGDHWIIGARPSTPKPVVPWNLEGSAAPHGPRRFYSPLALLNWTIEDEELQVAVHSCRRTFRPLTRLRGCCTVTVGDERTSFGDFTSINEALRAIPLDEPGKICVLPGEYHERVIMTDRSNLIIEGCGARTRLGTPEDNATSAGIITIERCTNITLRSMRIEATGQFGVMVLGGLVEALDVSCREILLENLDITTRRDPTLVAPPFKEMKVPAGSSPFPLSTIAVYLTERLKILGCNLTMVGDPSGATNVILNQASYAIIRDCRIRTPSGAGAVTRAFGGVQLHGGLHVTVERNEIWAGIGHGITLGAVAFSLAPSLGYMSFFDPGGRLILGDDEDCPSVVGELPLSASASGSEEEFELYFKSAPSRLKILRNRIHALGGSGISVVGVGPEPPVAPFDNFWMIGAEDLVIADNIIENNCTRYSYKPPTPELSHMIAFGGIVLGIADGLRIHDNLIQNNGLDHRNPVCGVFVYHGEDIAVENNLIRANGRRIDGTALEGNRAGIALQFVGRRVSLLTGAEVHAVDPDNLMPAARVRGNVVHQPAGRALQIYGLGAMFIEGNVFVSEGLTGGETVLMAHCIEVQNVGQSPELALQGAIPANLAFLPSPPLPAAPLPIADDLLDGRILFTDNQVHFKPVASAAVTISWAVRLQSYGDVAVLNNQFLTTFPAVGGSMVTDTSVTAWSTRTNNNRWEDPIVKVTETTYQTDASAFTLARMNFTTLNQASRCIHVYISPNSPVIDNNPIANNQTYTVCVLPGFGELLSPP